MKLSTIATAATLVFASTFSARAETVDILLNNFTPPTFFMSSVLSEWGEQVEDVTEGRVRVTMPAQSLAPPPEQWNAVNNGIFDAAWIFNGFIGNRIGLTMIGQLPFITGTDSEATGVALWNTHEKFFAEQGEYEGVHLLSLFAFSGAGLFSLTDEPINSVEEMAARRIWALPGPSSNVAKSTGSAIVSSPATQVYDFVSRNVVEGFYGIPLNVADQYNVLDYAKSLTEFPREVFSATFSLFIHEDVWSKISPEDQAAIMSVAGASVSSSIGQVVNSMEEAARQKATDAGMEFVEASPEFYAALRDAVGGAEQAWIERANAAGIDGQQAMDFFKAEVARLEQD